MLLMLRIIEYFRLKKKVKEDQEFLLAQSLKKAAGEGYYIKIGDVPIPPEARDRKLIVAPDARNGRFDATEMFRLLVDDYPEIIVRYFENVERIEKWRWFGLRHD